MRLHMQERGISAGAGLNPLAQPARSKYERLIQKAKAVPAVTTIVVHPCDESSLRGAVEAAEAGIIIPTLVGPVAKISTAAREGDLDISHYSIIDAAHSEDAAARGVAMIRESKGELLMKGSLHTDELMRPPPSDVKRHRPTHGPADQPCLHYGRADLC
jgi:phosphotransacetylase